MANWYVRPTQQGSNNGTSWSNAWTMGTISWGSISAGDTIWVAGGAYASQLTNSMLGGSAGNPVKMLRVTASDSVPVASPGWQAGFDSQVTGGMSSVNPQPAGSLHDFTIDGRTADGFKWTIANGDSSFWLTPGNNITFKYCTWIGPGWGAFSGYGVAIFAGTGHLFDHCKWDGIIQQLTIDTPGVTVQYCTFLNAGPGTANAHSDMIYCGGASGLIVRYCYFWNSWSQAFFWDGGNSGADSYIYGNVAVQGPDGSGTWFQCKQGYTWAPFHFYNNTMANWSTAGIQFRGTLTGSNTMYNNLFWHTTWVADSGTTGMVGDYNGYSSGVPSGDGTHSLSNATDPYVNSADPAPGSVLNWQLASAGAWPRLKGTALLRDGFIDYDMLGHNRAINGSTWDLGAFEVFGTAVVPGFVQAANSGPPSGTATVKTATFAALQTAGNMNAVIISFGSASSGTATNVISSVADTKGNVYTAANTWQFCASGATSLGQIIYCCPNIAAATAGTNVVTVTLSSAMAFFSIGVIEESGCALTSPVDVFVGAVANSTAPNIANSGPVSTTNANDLLLGAVSLFDGPSGTPNITAGFTQRAAYYTELQADEAVSATGSYSFNATSSGTSGWVAQLVAFKAMIAAVHFPMSITASSVTTLTFHGAAPPVMHFPMAISDSSATILGFRITAGVSSAPLFVQTANSGIPSGPATFKTASFGSAQTTGNLNVILIFFGQASTIPISLPTITVTDTKGNLYAAAGPFTQANNGTDGFGLILYYAPNIVSAVPGGNTVTVALSGAYSFFTIAAFEYSGIIHLSPLDVYASNQANGSGAPATFSSGSATNTGTNDLIFGAAGCYDGPSSVGAPFIQRMLKYVLIAGDCNASSSAAQSFTGTSTGGSGWVASMIAFKGLVSQPITPVIPPLPPDNVNPPFMPVSFLPGPPTALIWEDGPGAFTNPPNTGAPVRYNGQAQQLTINTAAPPPPPCRLPGAAPSYGTRVGYQDVRN